MPPLLIDVRSPAEFATGYLEGAINIEYTEIHELSQLLPDTLPSDHITLYCRSGRRSAIALNTLAGLGFANVRDIGSLEEAEQTLRSERESRDRDAAKNIAGEKEATALLQPASHASDAPSADLIASYEVLLAGLKSAADTTNEDQGVQG